MFGHTVVTYDEIPPSSNTNSGVGGRGNPKGIARTKGRWEGIFAMLMLQAKLPRNCTRVRVNVRLEFRLNKTRRDADNFYFPIAKPLGDALVKGGWLPDDTSTHYEFERVEISPEKLESPNPLVKGRMTLTIHYEMASPPAAPPHPGGVTASEAGEGINRVSWRAGVRG